MSRLHLHIDRLVLDAPGWDRRGAAELQAALEAELVRHWQTGDLAASWQGGGAVASLPAASVAWRAEEGASALGASIGGAVARSLES